MASAILGAAEGHDHSMISQMPDLTRAFGRNTGQQALDMAGVSHSDLDLMMIYDSFTYTVLVSLENLGFCGPGGRSGLGGEPADCAGRRFSGEHVGWRICRTRTRGCTGYSPLWRRSGSCAARLASGSWMTATWRWRMGPEDHLSSTGTVILSCAVEHDPSVRWPLTTGCASSWIPV